MVDQQIAVRWCPLADIPESPIEDFVFESSRAGQLRLVLRYSQIPVNPDRDLELMFSDALALRMHWEGDAPLVGGRLVDPPHCVGDQVSQYIWPLLIVKNSRWLVSGDFDTSNFFAEAEKREPWQQFTFLTLERSIDIIARGEVSANWIASLRSQ
jgi:hypothetical protein